MAWLLIPLTMDLMLITQILIVSTQNPPRPVSRFKEIDRKLAVPRGSQAVLPCPVENHHGIDRDVGNGNSNDNKYDEVEDDDDNDHIDQLFIEWTKDGSSLNVFDTRYRQTSHGSLRIKDTQLTDSGMYTCVAINGFGAVEMTIQLIVFDENGQSIESMSSLPDKSTTTTTTTTTTMVPEIGRSIDEDLGSFPVDPLDPLSATINAFNPSAIEPKILGSSVKLSTEDDFWSDKLSLPFIVASIGAVFLVLIIILLLLSYVKLRSPLNPKLSPGLDRSDLLFGRNNLDQETTTRHYNMYPIGNNYNANNSQSTPGHGSFSGLTLTTTPSHHHVHHPTPPRQPLPPPPPPTLPHSINQMTPSHYTIISSPHSNELRTVPSDKTSSPVDSSVIYESPLEFDLKPAFARKTPYGYLC